MKISVSGIYLCISRDAPIAGEKVIVTRLSVKNDNPALDLVTFRTLSSGSSMAGWAFTTTSSQFFEDFMDVHEKLEARETGYLAERVA